MTTERAVLGYSKRADNNNYRKLNGQDERWPQIVSLSSKIEKLLLQSDKSLSQRAKTLV